MKRSRQRIPNLIVLVGALLLAGFAMAADNVGNVVALKGAALIERDAKSIEAKLKDGILLRDTVETKESAKAKLLFIDDSVLTMAEKSKVVIREFIYSKDARGRSIFNLIDGKMRSVVGKSEFEVHTPTVVAAARGTVFECEIGKSGARVFTTCTCFEGIVEIRNIDPKIPGSVSLKPGMSVTVMSGQPVPPPTAAPPAPTTTLKSSGMAVEAAAESIMRTIQAPPIPNQQPQVTPPVTETPVNVGVKLPPAPLAPPTGSVRVGW